MGAFMAVLWDEAFLSANLSIEKEFGISPFEFINTINQNVSNRIIRLSRNTFQKNNNKTGSQPVTMTQQTLVMKRGAIVCVQNNVIMQEIEVNTIQG